MSSQSQERFSFDTGGEALAEICQEYELGKHSSAGSVIERVEKELARDKQFKRRVEELETLLTKSQTEI